VKEEDRITNRVIQKEIIVVPPPPPNGNRSGALADVEAIGLPELVTCGGEFFDICFTCRDSQVNA
jgi:hypothetical protein